MRQAADEQPSLSLIVECMDDDARSPAYTNPLGLYAIGHVRCGRTTRGIVFGFAKAWFYLSEDTYLELMAALHKRNGFLSPFEDTNQLMISKDSEYPTLTRIATRGDSFGESVVYMTDAERKSLIKKIRDVWTTPNSLPAKPKKHIWGFDKDGTSDDGWEV